jgi:hypothetical protein
MTRVPTKAVLLSANALPTEYKSKVGETRPTALQPRPAKRKIDEAKCFLLNKNKIVITE